MTQVTNPYPLWLDGRGMLLDGGSIYIGQPNTDPTILANQVALFRDVANTVPLTQPVRTLGGVAVDGRNKVFVHTPAADYSIVVKDAQGDTVYSLASINTGGVIYQVASANLASLSAASQTSYGVSLLSLANAAALRAATEIPPSLPLAGGIMSANITRAGAGPHLFHIDPAFASGRVFVTESSASDPTTQDGDIWIKLT